MIALYICPDTHPFSNPTNTTDKYCYNYCPERYSYDFATYNCTACMNQKCLKCIPSMTDCLTCKLEDFRELVLADCLPISGYYESNTNIAAKCSISCTTCRDSSTCLTCNEPFYIWDLITTNICVQCSVVFSHCITCSIQ
jgi:hypothetical protein